MPSPCFLHPARLIRLALAAAGAATAMPAPASSQPDREAPGGAAARALEAMGGREALSRVRSLRGSGTVELLGGFPGRFELSAARPDRRHLMMDIGYIRVERAFDGNAGWERIAAVRELVGRELERTRAWAAVLPLLDRLLDEAAVGEPPASPGEGPALQLGGPPVTRVELDPVTRLPVKATLTLPYDEGDVQTVVEYGDWRRVGSIRLPHRIAWGGPDLPWRAAIDRYEVNVALDSARFRNPNAGRAAEPFAVTLATIPRNVYREEVVTGWQRSWGIPFPPTERWILDVVVNEALGRWVPPLSASIDYLAGDTVVKSQRFTGAGLERILKVPVTRFAPQPQIYNFRLEAYEPVPLGVDRLAVRFEGATPTGGVVAATLAVPISTYRRPPLLFPVKGRFIIANGHAFHHLNHVYEWSQHFGNDIVCLGPDFELTVGGRLPERNEDFHAFGGCEILAPDDGVVVFARNDVPDGRVPAEYLRMEDPIWAIGGNIILLDHGAGVYSLLAHNQMGSVRVSPGDRVARGQVLARMGASGSPGFPHLHYQLQSSPRLFDGDGLPATFANVFSIRGEGPVPVPQAGIHYVAR